MEQHMIRLYGFPKQYKDPRADKIRDHRKRGKVLRWWKESKPVRKDWHRLNRRYEKFGLKKILSGDYDFEIVTLKKTGGRWTH